MAKYRHRTFEMYDDRDEAILALTPRQIRPTHEESAPETWKFKHLSVSRPAEVTLVKFKSAKKLGLEEARDLAADFLKLSDLLGRDSKVLVDFTGVASDSFAFVDALTPFNSKLQNKGSRMAVCALAPAAREAFFATR